MVDVPISGVTAMPVALVNGSATQLRKASPQLPPYMATVSLPLCACAAVAKVAAANTAAPMMVRVSSPICCSP
ncbi:hypothetical protein D3C72_2419200 [compost metagenome]